MKLGLVSLGLPVLFLALVSGCAARPPAQAPATTELSSADVVMDDAWMPPDALGIVVDESKLAEPSAPAAKRAPRPRHAAAPNAKVLPRGSVHAAVD